jgi:hypothetical protein
MSASPLVSVVLVSDYAAGETKSWNDLRVTLAALAAQDYEGPVEVILCEDRRFEGQVPDDVLNAHPNLRMLYSSGSTSYELKNEGARVAGGEFLGMLDADCAPAKGWVSSLVRALSGNPRAAAVSGRTTYAGRNFQERLLALLGRSYLDTGTAGRTSHVANNNGGYRRAAYLEHLLPEDAGPFASTLQSEALQRAGWKLLFEPGMHSVHDFEGWGMEADIRRNLGYGTVITRLRDRLIRYGWLTRLGYLSVPFFAFGKLLETWASCFRCARYYGVRWFELPVALGLAVPLHLMEIPGMVLAFRGSDFGETAYR